MALRCPCAAAPRTARASVRHATRHLTCRQNRPWRTSVRSRTLSDTPPGILNPGVIDEITTDAAGFVTLHVVQTCAWDESDQLLLLLQEKLFNYLAFVADGELARRQPGQRTRWGGAIDCATEP